MIRAVTVLAFTALVFGQSQVEHQMAMFTKTTELTRVAFIQHQGPYQEIPMIMGQLYKWIEENGYTAVGPPIGVYSDDPEKVPQDSVRWAIEVPIAEEAEEKKTAEGIGIKMVQPMLVAVTYHKGPYDDVGKTYARLFSWVMKSGYEITGPPRELYWSDPETTPQDKSVSELQIPVKTKEK